MFKKLLLLLSIFMLSTNGLSAEEGIYAEVNFAAGSDNFGLGNNRKVELKEYGTGLVTVDSNNNLPVLYELQKDGGSVGITVGFIKKNNYFKYMDYIGIEANYSLSRIIGEQDQFNPASVGLDGNSSGGCQGTHYARAWLKNYQMLNFIIGKKISNRIDIYAKAGPAMGKSERFFGTTWTGGGCGAVEGTDKSVDIGYNIGLDGVFFVTKNIGLKLGYNFIDLQDTDVWGGGKAPYTTQVRTNDLKYSFDNVYHNYVVAIKYFF
jgi:opacity protein-like surface antigen